MDTSNANLATKNKMTVDEHITNAYYDGMIDGVRLFAHWKDGEQFVGTCGKTLKKAIEDIEKLRANALVNPYVQ